MIITVTTVQSHNVLPTSPYNYHVLPDYNVLEKKKTYYYKTSIQNINTN
jgi:hypothetical protein